MALFQFSVSGSIEVGAENVTAAEDTINGVLDTVYDSYGLELSINEISSIEISSIESNETVNPEPKTPQA